jgi:hypothetical protein
MLVAVVKQIRRRHFDFDIHSLHSVPEVHLVKL